MIDNATSGETYLMHSVHGGAGPDSCTCECYCYCTCICLPGQHDSRKNEAGPPFSSDWGVTKWAVTAA